MGSNNGDLLARLREAEQLTLDVDVAAWHDRVQFRRLGLVDKIEVQRMHRQEADRADQVALGPAVELLARSIEQNGKRVFDSAAGRDFLARQPDGLMLELYEKCLAFNGFDQADDQVEVAKKN